MKKNYSSLELKKLIIERIKWDYGIEPEQVSRRQIFKSTSRVIRGILSDMYAQIHTGDEAHNAKQLYYLSMEFLPGTSLHNNAFNLQFEDSLREAVNQLGFDLDELYSLEPDAGLGNGGLGRLASCYLDALTGQGMAAHGMSICYEYGIFKQRILENKQTEEPDLWLDMEDCWLIRNKDEIEEVQIGDRTILAIPHDMFISGYDSDIVNSLRLWEATSPVAINMELFAQGKYLESMEERHLADVISKILYPEDAHEQGKILRITQQYFFISASMQSIVKKHFAKYGTISNFHDKIAVHINDTHPTMVIPELMRIFMDDYNLDWEYAWDIVTRTVSYTNHTIMSEALETWNENLFARILPRISEIIHGINGRFMRRLAKLMPDDPETRERMAIIRDGKLHMANLCVMASHKVNGVSALHSDIIKKELFPGFVKLYPSRFLNVTNGIAYRRWLCQSNPQLSELISNLIGTQFKQDSMELEKLLAYQDDHLVLDNLKRIKYGNKLRLAEYIKEKNDVVVNPDSIFDVQAKRIHEYKRQLLNLIHILDLYLRLKDNPNEDISPRTFIFAGKSASGYYIAKQIISLACNMAEMIERDPLVRERIKIVFLENYSVSLSEILLPAADVSEQISLAGKEASGTGNMKLMINGAVTLGTLDGANIEIKEQVGEENIFIFGMKANEVEDLRRYGAYNPISYLIENPSLARVVELFSSGINGVNFNDIFISLTTGYNGSPDQYFVLKDFEDYKRVQKDVQKAYEDENKWSQMSLVNIAKSGLFSADRAVLEYAEKIWNLDEI